MRALCSHNKWTVVLDESFLSSLLYRPFLPLLSAVTVCCLKKDGGLPTMTLLSFLVSYFRSGNWVTKLSGAECKIEGPRVSPVNKGPVYATSFVFLS